MFGSPLKEATWNTAEGAIYNGATVLAEGAEAPLWYTSSEGIWLLISIGPCVFALLVVMATKPCRIGASVIALGAQAATTRTIWREINSLASNQKGPHRAALFL